MFTLKSVRRWELRHDLGTAAILDFREIDSKVIKNTQHAKMMKINLSATVRKNTVCLLTLNSKVNMHVREKTQSMLLTEIMFPDNFQTKSLRLVRIG